MNRFDFQDTAKNPVTVPTQKRTSPKQKVEENRATDTGITPNLYQGKPLQATLRAWESGGGVGGGSGGSGPTVEQENKPVTH